MLCFGLVLFGERSADQEKRYRVREAAVFETAAFPFFLDWID